MKGSAAGIGVVVVLMLISMAWLIDHYRNNAVGYKKQRDDISQALGQANNTIKVIQIRQREVAVLDAKYQKELADAKAQNDALQRKLDNGGRVLVKGKCPVSITNQTTSTSSMGDDVSVELTSIAGRNVLGIRSGIIRDQAALKALQEYIKTQCLN